MDRVSNTRGVVPGSGKRERAENQKALQILRAYIHESKENHAHRIRLERNKLNYHEFRGDKDWSHKARGQSREHLPKLRMASEQISIIIKKGLVDLGGSWYSIDVQGDVPPIVRADDLKKIMNIFLESNDVNFPTKISDAAKAGYLESDMTLKIFGAMMPKNKFEARPGEFEPITNERTGNIIDTRQRFQLVPVERDVWTLKVEVLPYETHLKDPRGSDLYEIHRVTRDLWKIRELAERGVYDKKVVNQLANSLNTMTHEERTADLARGQDPELRNKMRPQVTINEVWGRLVGKDGDVFEITVDGDKQKARNVMATVANEHFLIRKPIPNPNWDEKRPFVSTPIIRIPHAVIHDSLGDHVQSLNNAIDELYNLMLDAGMKSVWGISQLRPDFLDDPDQVTEGIPPFETLILRPGTPDGARVFERVDTGANMGEAFGVMNFTLAQFADAAAITQTGQGQLPTRQVKATEVVATQQAQSVFFDGLIKDIEDTFIEPALQHIFHLVMQNLHLIDVDDLVAAVGTRIAFVLLALSPEERFAMFGNRVKFRVHGLTSMVTRAREFQRLLALLQVLSQNPVFGQTFAAKYSFAKLIDRIVRSLEIDPDSILIDTQEEGASQIQLLRQFIEAQVNNTGQVPPQPQEQLPSATNEIPGISLPPGIEGGGGENLVEGQSLNQRQPV